MSRETIDRIRDECVPIIAKCGWCRKWIDDPPKDAYVESTGMCEDCAREHFPEDYE